MGYRTGQENAEWSPYRKNLTKTIDIPESGGLQIGIRKIGKRGLEQALFQLQRQAIARINEIGGPSVVASMSEMGGQQAPKENTGDDATTAVRRDPFLGLDPITLISLGVETWPMGTISWTTDGVQLENLDPTFEDWLARQIYDFEEEDKPKNG